MEQTDRAERYSWHDYLSASTDERFELIGGVPYAMSPAPRREHQRLVSTIHYQIFASLKDNPCQVYPAPFDVKLTSAEADDEPTVVQPDLTVVCDQSKLTEQGMTGAPDLVVEVVSPDSGYHDRGRKFDLYRFYGIKEYWIVDPDERVVEVYRLRDGAYDRVGVFSTGEVLDAAAVPAVRVDLSEVFPARNGT